VGTNGATAAPNLPISTWTRSQGVTATYEPVIAQHRLAELDLFSNASLADRIERHPRSLLEIFSPDPGARGEEGWKPVALGGATGQDVIDAVERGRIWVLLPRVHENDPEFNELNAKIRDEMTEVIPGFVGETMTSTVLISSPTATVPYHLDGIPNLLWHIRGEKRAYLYPPDVDEFVDPRFVEDILVNDAPEYIPYDPDFESAALPFDLTSGQVLAIPHYAPHRVENLSGLNVSLNTELDTVRTRRRNAVRMANRYFSRRMHLPVHSRVVEGNGARAKRVALRMAHRVGLDRQHARPPKSEPLLRIDPNAPEGVSPILDDDRARVLG
jgi:Cupin-like domain